MTTRDEERICNWPSCKCPMDFSGCRDNEMKIVDSDGMVVKGRGDNEMTTKRPQSTWDLINSLEKERQDLRNQNDELVAALEAVLEMTEEDEALHCGDASELPIDGWPCHRPTTETARNLLARVKGESNDR